MKVIGVNEKPNGLVDFDIGAFDCIGDKATRVSLMLSMLWELAGLHYKAECAAREYCIKEFAEVCNAYGELGARLREKLLKEINK